MRGGLHNPPNYLARLTLAGKDITYAVGVISQLYAARQCFPNAQGTATRSTMGASLTGTSKWYGGVLGPDGKVYGIPHTSTDILIIDPVAGTATRSAMGASLTDTSKWDGGVLGPDGKVYGIPHNATDILIIALSARAKLPEHLLLSPYLNKF